MLRGVCVRAAIGAALMAGLVVAGDAAVWNRAGIRLVSRGGGVSGATRNSFALAVSPDGRFVMFSSEISTLVTRDRNERYDVFVKDRARGRVVRVSLGSGGQEASGDSYYGGLSDDGRTAVFESDAWNLGVDLGILHQVYVRDLRRRETRPVAVAEDGSPANAGSHVHQGSCLSGDGQHVVFFSRATNLVPGADNGVIHVYLADLETRTLTLVSASPEGVPGDGDSYTGGVSADGRFVAFSSEAANLVVGDSNGVSDVFLYDTVSATTTRVSVASDGAEANGASYFPAVSDGGLIAFHSQASDLVESDSNASLDVFLHDSNTGETSRLSVTPDGEEVDGDSYHPAISRDGTRVVFGTDADGLVPEDGNGYPDVVARDLVEGTAWLVSVGMDGSGANARSWPGACALSSSGTWSVFDSSATNLVPRDRNGDLRDVFIAPVR